jgi:hypothetical protein
MLQDLENTHLAFYKKEQIMKKPGEHEKTGTQMDAGMTGVAV